MNLRSHWCTIKKHQCGRYEQLTLQQNGIILNSLGEKTKDIIKGTKQNSI